MKKLFNYAIVALMVMVVAVSFTSCLDSNDDNSGLSDEQKKQYAMMMSGSYSGGLIYYDQTLDASIYKNQLDTLKGTQVRFSAANQTATIFNFPTRLLVKAISGHADMKEALAATEYVDLTMDYSVIDAYESAVSYFLSPRPVYITLEYGNKKHEMAFAFAQNMNYSNGVYTQNTNGFTFTLAAVYDGKDEKGEYKLLDNKVLLRDGITQKEYNNICFVFNSKK